LSHWLNTLLNILKTVVCECACIYICSANLALQILDVHSVIAAEASDPGKLLVSIIWTEGNSVYSSCSPENICTIITYEGMKLKSPSLE